MKNKTLASIALLGLGGLAGGATLTLAETAASAAPFFERIAGSQCVFKYPTMAWHTNSVGATTPAQLAYGQGDIGYFLCPIPDKTALPAAQLANIDLYVLDQNDNGTTNSSSYQVSARVCSTSNGGFASCGSRVYSSGTGYKTVSLTSAVLGEVDTYSVPYLYVSLPPYDVGASAIIGATYSKL
jgi:hypothetical protein